MKENAGVTSTASLIQGRDGARHDLYGCRAPDSQAARQWMLQVRRQIQYT